MGEKIGFMTVLVLFSIFLLPLSLNTFFNHIEGGKMLSLTAEMQQLVSAEGGVSQRVNDVVEEMEGRGVGISFQDENGNPINSKVDVGTKVIIHYEYKDFETSNSTVITRRS